MRHNARCRRKIKKKICITFTHHYHHYNHQYHQANRQLAHLFACSGLTRLEFSLIVTPGFFCPLVVYSYLLFSIIHYVSIYMLKEIYSVFLYFAQNWGYLILMQFQCFFYSLSKFILLFCSYISSLLLLSFLSLL